MTRTNQLKKVSELSREDKINLLESIKAGEIDPKELSSKSIIVSEERQAFQSLMMSVAFHEAGERSPFILVGKAKDLIKKLMASIMEQRENLDHEKH